ncbi:hypothetical protein VdG1_04142 [Verticillium dahliae VDG1]|nr:hypothetical protein VdG1_04142 [Verticillium dahliae VDG1]
MRPTRTVLGNSASKLGGTVPLALHQQLNEGQARGNGGTRHPASFDAVTFACLALVWFGLV